MRLLKEHRRGKKRVLRSGQAGGEWAPIVTIMITGNLAFLAFAVFAILLAADVATAPAVPPSLDDAE